MKSESAGGPKVIQIFVPGIPDTPGWVALPHKKQEQIVEHMSRLAQYDQMKGMGEFGGLVELHQIEQILEGEEMKVRDLLRKKYPDRTLRTIDRKRKFFREFAEKVPLSVMNKLAAASAETLGQFERIANASLGHIMNAIRELPALPAKTGKDAEEYLEALDAKLLENRQATNKGRPLRQNEEAAAKMATNAVIAYMRKCSQLKTSADKRKWLTRVVGWVMEAQAVSGALRSIHRQTIPDGVLIKRGRPPKKRRLEAA